MAQSAHLPSQERLVVKNEKKRLEIAARLVLGKTGKEMKRKETLQVIPLAPLGRFKLLSEDVRNRRLALAVYLMGPPEGIGFYLVNSLFRVHLRPVGLMRKTKNEAQE